MAGRFKNLEVNQPESPLTIGPPVSQQDRFDAGAHLQRAAQEYQWGRFDAALRYYTRCLQEDRSLVPAWTGQVQMLVQLGEFHEARVWSDKALEIFRNNGELLAAKAQACARLGDRSAAKGCSDTSLTMAGSSAWRWQARGEVLLAAGDRNAAYCFDKSLLEPGVDWFDRLVIARIYMYYEQFTNALGHIRAAIGGQPAHGYLWFCQGECERALGLMPAAQVSYGRCLDLRADYQEARVALRQAQAGGGFLRGLWRRLLG